MATTKKQEIMESSISDEKKAYYLGLEGIELPASLEQWIDAYFQGEDERQALEGEYN